MKKVWNVETRLMNGTVTILTITDSFATEELANKAADALREVNKKNGYSTVIRVYEGIFYENESEVPVLNPPDPGTMPFNTMGINEL